MASLVITAVGPDRPGIVGDLTGHLLDAGANIADSRAINLQGQFVLVLLVQVDDARAAALSASLTDTGRGIGVSVTVVPASGTDPAKLTPPVKGVPYRLRTYAMDQPGIVHRITHLLHNHHINIEELQTRLEPGSVSGTPLFTMDLRMTVPATIKINALRGELSALCDSLNCDLDLQPA